jgi:hypothetical protein
MELSCVEKTPAHPTMREPRVPVGPQTYRILTFFTGLCGLDYILLQKVVFCIADVKSGTNFAGSYWWAPMLESRGGGGAAGDIHN